MTGRSIRMAAAAWSRRVGRGWRWAEAFVLLAAGPVVAQAVMGQTIVTWAAQWVIAPLAALAILITITAALFKPEMARTAGYIAVVAVVVFLLMSQYGNLVGIFTGSAASGS